MNYNWKKNIKVILYCQIGRAIDLADFSITSAINNAGLQEQDFDIFFITWKTSLEVYNWLKKNNYKYIDMQYDEGKGFLWNLYKGWNLGYEIGYKYANYVVPIATDHCFYKDWLKNLLKNAKENRIVCCKLIEPGTIPTLHTAINFGITTYNDFKINEFNKWSKNFVKINENKLIFDDCIPNMKGGKYGHRLDAMPFIVPKNVWNKFGPMKQYIDKVTGDTDFFNRCKNNNVEITKALDSISYHCGGLETQRNKQNNIYT